METYIFSCANVTANYQLAFDIGKLALANNIPLYFWSV